MQACSLLCMLAESVEKPLQPTHHVEVMKGIARKNKGYEPSMVAKTHSNTY